MKERRGERGHARRCWPRITIAFVGAVLLLAVGAGGFVWWKTLPPAPVDAMPVLIEAREALQPRGADGEIGEDAWPRYVALFRDTLGMAHFHDRDATALSRRFFDTEARWALEESDRGDPAADGANAALAGYEPVLAALRHATDAGACRFPLVPEDARFAGGMPFDVADIHVGPESERPIAPPGLSHWTAAGRLLRLDARVALASREPARAGAAVERLFTFAAHQGMVPSSLGAVVRASLEERAYEMLRVHTLSRDLSPEEVDALLAAVEPGRRHWALGDLIARMVKVEAVTTGRRFAREMRVLKHAPMALIQPSARAMAREGERELLRLAEGADLPWHERPARDRPMSLAAYYVADPWRSAVDHRDRARSKRAAVRSLLLLEKHHATTGAWPATLEEAMPVEETLDPNTNTPFVYALTPGAPTPFTLHAPADATFVREEDRDVTRRAEPKHAQRPGRGAPSTQHGTREGQE